MADQSKELHIVMFPWLAFGHLIPFLEFSKSLAHRGHRISFVSTPRNIARLPKLPAELEPLISFVKLTLPHVDGLPENAEATSDISIQTVPYLKKAFDDLELPLARILEISSPDWIIYDFAPYWLPSLASKLGVPCAFFSPLTAATIAFYGPPRPMASTIADQNPRTKPEHYTVPPKWVPSPSNLAFRLHESQKIFSGSSANASDVSDRFRFRSTIDGCNVVALRSCEEFEAEWVHLLQGDLFQTPVIPVGFLSPVTQNTRDGDDDDDDDRWIVTKEWLAKQSEGSVVYIALGSEATLSQDEMNEFALGLEQSGLPFFWVLRFPPGPTGTGSGYVLPSGFEKRTGDRGFICRGWAPQLRVLAHPSVGSFVTHCGWSSIIESFGLGCPLLLLPLLSDQPLNARLLQGKKLGLEIPRDERDGSLSRDAVAESLRIVMVEKAEFFKAQAREMQEIFSNKARQDQYVDDFSQYLIDNARQSSMTSSQRGLVNQDD